MLFPGMDEDEDEEGEEKLNPGHGEAVDKAPVLRAPVLRQIISIIFIIVIMEVTS